MAAEPVAPITLTVETTASPAAVWAALTDPARVAEWLTEASPVRRVGDAYRLDFGEGTAVEGVVTALDPGRGFAHTWAWTGVEPPETTQVSWAIAPRDGGGTTITLVHDGWAAADLDEAAREDHEGYWTGYLEDLVAILDEPA
jgi:uncharacterized protein YndB with AHSA1/START domain